MSCKPILRDVSQQTQLHTSEASQHLLPNGKPRPAMEMARVLKTAPVSMASDPASGAIAHWKHGALHDVVKPMADHVIMTYPSGVQRLERRNGKSAAIGTARSGSATIIPAGSSARWDISGPVNVVQLYLPTARSSALPAKPTRPRRTSCWSERASDPITSRLLISASDAIQAARRWMRCSGTSSTIFSPHASWLHMSARLPIFSRPWAALRQPRCAARSSVCTRTTIRTPPLPRWLRMPPVAFLLQPRLQGEHGALAACLASPAPA